MENLAETYDEFDFLKKWWKRIIAKNLLV